MDRRRQTRRTDGGPAIEDQSQAGGQAPGARFDYDARAGKGRPIHTFTKGDHLMSKSQDAKKNVKKAPTKTPKEKKEAKRLKKAGK